ncbi:MAG: hypothetical protein GY805_22005 [Chloroflexi bacterium]|nr:hypothetical protein [Chloroflexota bacterium]
MLSESVTAVEPQDRLKLRRSLINPNDGLAHERILGESDLIKINYLAMGIEASRPICRIQIRASNGCHSGFGTGFMVSPTLLMTNHHVLERKLLAIRSLAEFNFEDDINFLPKASKVFQLDPDKFFYNDRALDFALVAVKPQAIDNTPLTRFGHLNLVSQSGKALVEEFVSIIQHPNGGDKQIALRNNRILNYIEDFVHYEADTQRGSSGSPVFNDQWEVVALHHAGVPKRNKNGRILTKNGRVWKPEMGEDKIKWVANEGIRISAIFRHLNDKADWTRSEKQFLNKLNRRSQLAAETTISQTRPFITMPDSGHKLPDDVTASSPKAITIEEFYKLVDDDDVTEAQLAPYIQLDQENTNAFSPAFKLNYDLVADTRGLESDLALTWLNDWSRRRRQRRYRRKLAQGGSIIKIVSEGDSWFQFPVLIKETVDHLMDHDDLAVFSLGAAGDLLRNMIARAEYLNAVEQENPQFLLFSGGGNDLVNNSRLSSLLHPFSSGRAPKEYPNSAFNTFLDEISADYERLFNSVTTRFPNLTVFCHGYDYAIPSSGPWLGRPMERNGINDATLQRQIMAILVDRLNEALSQVAAPFPPITYLDLRGIVPANGWFDELHPRSSFFGQIAGEFLNVIN